MKRLSFLVLFLYVAHGMQAQEVVVKDVYVNPGTYRSGLYNERTKTWVTKPEYEERTYSGTLGSYAGVYYYAFKKNGLWGILNEKGQVVSDFQWEGVGLHANGFFAVSRNGSAGLIDVYDHVIVKLQYKRVSVSMDSACLIPWEGNQQVFIPMNELVQIRDKMRREEKLAAASRAHAEHERAKREAKERELARFTEYARSFVEPQVNEWQHKGEFEKMADYQRRVTGPNRTAMIDSLTRVAERKFISEHAALHPEKDRMDLAPYDSENEVFFVESAKLGQMVVPVPIAEGPDFKDHFNSMERRNPVFYIVDDKVALASLDFYDPQTRKTYHYSNGNALSYNHYDIDPDNYQFDLVNVVTAKTAEPSAAAVPQRPVITILSPEKNAPFSDPRVTVRYQARVFDGSEPVLHVWVNGQETEPIPPMTTGAAKGVAPAWKAVDLILPKDREHPCHIMLSVTDGSGYSSENKTVSVQYVGELPKPRLHLFAVGVSNYTSRSLTKLAYAAKDAQDFVSAVSGSDVSMYERVVQPVVLTDGAATKADIERGLANLTRTVEQDDVVMLFFSGHGVLDGEDAYFMSVDAVSGDPYTGVDFALIRKNMVKMKDKKCRVLIFMDACYSGAMFNAKSALKNITFAENDIIGFYSSTASQTSAEMAADENGLFTKALIQGLKGQASSEDGEITTFGLQKFISDYVSKQSGGRQSPIVENKLGDLVLYKVK